MRPEVSRSRLDETVDALATGRISRKEFVRRATLLGLSASAIASLLATGAGATSKRRKKRLRGPLRVHPDNPRYFTDGPGRPPVYLAGTNTWGTLQDGFVDGWFYSWETTFDFDGFLDLMSANDLNYIRFWLYETAWLTYYDDFSMFAPERPAPLPWRRTGPGTALDGRPKFDLTKFDTSYFKRVRDRVKAAGDRGIYVSVMLFEGWSTVRRDGHDAWPGHPFNVNNNVNGIDGNPNGDTTGSEIHSLQIPAVLELQERYARKIVDTVNHLDNVIYETPTRPTRVF